MLFPALVCAQGLDPKALLKPATHTWPTYNGDYSGKRFSPLTEINADIPGWLVDLVDKLIAKDAAERFQSAVEVADLLGQSAKYKGFAEQCMAEYNLDGWTASDLINPDDISVVMKRAATQK